MRKEQVRIPRKYEPFEFADGKIAMIIETGDVMKVKPAIGVDLGNGIDQIMEYDKNQFPEVKYIFTENLGEGASKEYLNPDMIERDNEEFRKADVEIGRAFLYGIPKTKLK